MASISFFVGIIGNIISILVFASPIKTFWRVVKKKSTENYKGAPYITTLLSTSLWSLYGIIKPDILVLTVNAAGAALQFVYVILFFIYAPKDKKVKTMKMVGILNVGFFGAVIAVTLLALHGHLRITFSGILCAALTIGMYAAPLSAMRTVIKTKSVEYMPFLLSFFLFLNGGVWAAYSVLVKDFFIGVPNAIGFVLGSAQLIIYMIYKNKSPSTKSTEMIEKEASVIDPEKQGGEIHMGGGVGDEEQGNLKHKTLNKGKSMPKPSVDRQNSLQKITKALSWNAYELLQHSSWANNENA